MKKGKSRTAVVLPGFVFLFIGLLFNFISKARAASLPRAPSLRSLSCPLPVRGLAGLSLSPSSPVRSSHAPPVLLFCPNGGNSLRLGGVSIKSTSVLSMSIIPSCRVSTTLSESLCIAKVLLENHSSA